MNENTMASTPLTHNESTSVANPGQFGDLTAELEHAIGQFDEATDRGRSTIAGNEQDEAALALCEAAVALLTGLDTAQVTSSTLVGELPMVRVVETRYGPTLVCPVCDTRGRIVEVDEAIRHQELYIEDRRIRASSSRNEALWNHARFECEMCETPVGLPVPVAIRP
jgi:hypothetical protein